MLSKNYRMRLSTMLRLCCMSICLALTLSFCMVSMAASAHTTFAPRGGPTWRMISGFDAHYRDGSWVPIQISLRNDGPDFTGKVSAAVPEAYGGVGNTATSSRYQQEINLPTGAQKQVTLYIPMSVGSQGTSQNIVVDLLDSNNQKVSSQTSILHSLGANDNFVGVLSDQVSGLSALSRAPLPGPNAATIVDPLNATNMPTVAEALDNFNLLIVDNFTTSTLSKEQLGALEHWVKQGGSLLVVGGPEWRRTLSALSPNLLPVNVTGTSTLPAGTSLLPIGGPTKGGPNQSKVSDSVAAPLTVSKADARPGSSVVLASGSTPLLVQSQQERGNVYYLAFDPALDPITGWSSASSLWQGLLIRSIGDQLLPATPNTGLSGFPPPRSPNTNADWVNLLQALFPNAFPATWLILVLLLGYVVVLGPVRLVLVRIFKRRAWSWRIVLATIVVFSLLSYGLAIEQKGTSIISSGISIIQLDRTGAADKTNAHVTSYVGVFVPSQGDFQVHMAGNDLLAPVDDQFNIYGGPGQAANASEPTTITSTPNGTDATLQGVDIWTVRSLVSKHDAQVKGGIPSHLTLQNGRVTGTVTNTLPYALNDVDVLMGNQVVSLGHLAAGQTLSVDFLPNSMQSGNSQSLADQIATSHGESPSGGMGYYHNYNPSPLQTAAQRHNAILTTLSGENREYCGGGFCPMSMGASGSGNPSQTGERDPLLLPSAPATLIGWTDGPPDITSNLSINGKAVKGVQEALIQAPLDVNLVDAVDLSSNGLMKGQLVDVQDPTGTAQLFAPGVYTMTTGSMTFEFTAPTAPHLQATSLTISEPQNPIQAMSKNGPPAPPNAGPQGDVNKLQLSVYNWHTSSWDAFTLNQYRLAINNAQPYVDANGRVLVQFANQNSAIGTTPLAQPSLELQGTISH